MLKRNKMLAAFLVVAILCTGIVFASVIDTLNVSGGITLGLGNTDPLVQDFDEKVYFTKAEVDTDSSTTTTTTTGVTTQLTDEKDRVRITIDKTVFTEVGQKVVIVCTIQNENNQKANLKDFTSTLKENVGKCISVDWSFANGTTTSQEIEANGTTTLTVTVTLNYLPTGETASEADAFSCQFNAVPVIE